MNNIRNEKLNIFNLIYRLLKNINNKRKLQLFFVFLTMVASGLSEVFLLLILVPFIQSLTEPEIFYKNKIALNFFQIINVTDQKNMALIVTIIFIGACLTSSILRVFNLWIGGRFAAGLGTDISYKCYKKILYQPYSFHVSTNTSNIISLISKEVKNTTSIFQITLNMTTSLIILIFLSSALLTLDWKIFTLLSLSFLFLYSAIALRIKNILSENSRLMTFRNSYQIKIIQESIGSIRDLILSNLYNFYFRDFKNSEYKLRRIEIKNRFLQLSPRYVLDGLSFSLIGLLAFIVVSTSSSNLNLISLLGVLAFGAQRLLPNFQLVYAAWANIQGNKYSLKKVLDYLEDLKYKRKDNIRVKNVKFKRSIEFKNIYFKYSSGEDVLSGINLSFLKGEKVAIIGKSGAGKTTLLDIMTLLLKPNRGSIFVDQIDIINNQKESEIAGFRKLITYVPQYIYLTDNSIAENIAFGISKNEINYKRLKEVISIVQMQDFINNHPEGYFLKVGEKGTKLSGGQKQRIGLARALYKKSNILILDESTSGLDYETEQKVFNLIKLKRKDITLIMITHRLDNLKNFDKVFEIKNGKIIKLT